MSLKTCSDPMLICDPIPVLFSFPTSLIQCSSVYTNSCSAFICNYTRSHWSGKEHEGAQKPDFGPHQDQRQGLHLHKQASAKTMLFWCGGLSDQWPGPCGGVPIPGRSGRAGSGFQAHHRWRNRGSNWTLDRPHWSHTCQLSVHHWEQCGKHPSKVAVFDPLRHGGMHQPNGRSYGAFAWDGQSSNKSVLVSSRDINIIIDDT